VERIALIRPVEDHVAHRTTVFGQHKSHGQDPTGRFSRMHRLVSAIAGLEALDPVGEQVGKLARQATKPLKGLLSGSWLGHPLHPALTDVTIGTLTSALLLDWLGGEDSRPAARRLIGIGLLSATPVVASGASDWGDAEPATSRCA